MNLFEMQEWRLQVRPLAWGLAPFKKLLDRDKSADKVTALKEMEYIYHFADIKSIYAYIIDEKTKGKEIKKDLKLPARWRADKYVEDAITYYIERTKTTSSIILRDTLYTAQKLSTLMKNKVDTDELNVNEISKLTTGIKQMPDVIKAIQKTEDAVLKEQAEKSDSVGSQKKGMYEEGLDFED